MRKKDWVFILIFLLLVDVGVITTAVLYPRALAYAVAGLFTFGTVYFTVLVYNKIVREDTADEHEQDSQ